MTRLSIVCILLSVATAVSAQSYPWGNRACYFMIPMYEEREKVLGSEYYTVNVNKREFMPGDKITGIVKFPVCAILSVPTCGLK